MTKTYLPALAIQAALIGGVWALEGFEGDGFGAWVEEGEAFGKGPSVSTVPGIGKKFSGFGGDSFAASGHGGFGATGQVISPEFEIVRPFIHFRIAGGSQPGKTAVQLVADGEVLLEATGRNDAVFRPVTWDVRRWQGRRARLRIVDAATGDWGMIAADDFLLSESEKPTFPKASGSGSSQTLVDSAVIAGNTIPEGTRLEIYADHASHGLTSPTAFAFDEQGALLVAETHRFRFGVMDDRDHRYWYFDDLASQTTADRRALHEKWKHKLPLEKLTERSELVRRFTDPDGDGKADEMTVFADGFNDVLDGTAAGIFSYRGTAYFACIPTIHTLEDTDGDGVADRRGKVADGFGVRISLSGHDMNGFALGNDGRIYGTIGDRGFSLVTREGRKYHYPEQGAVFRFEPDGSNFEVIHTGLRNPKEIAFDEFGNGITVDNNSDQGDPSRIVYIMDGVDSGWRMQHQALHTFRADIGLPDRPISPWMTERMADTRNEEQPAFIVPPVANLTNGPSGLTYHPGNGFLESERGRFLICDYKASPAASHIWSFGVEREGAGMAYLGAYKFNSGVAPTDVEYGYDGRLYVADFIGGWTAHEGGRIYSLTAEKEENQGLTPETSALIREGFTGRPAQELAQLLEHPDQRVRMRAHIALAERPDATPFLVEATRQKELLPRLHGVWGLGIRARKDADAAAAAELEVLLGDADAEVRAQAAKALGEVAGTSAERLIPLLGDDSLRVRAFAAISLGRLKSEAAWAPLLTLLEENAGADLYLRHAGIMGLLGAGDAAAIAALKDHESSEIRLAAVVALRRLEDERIQEFLADNDPAVADEAIRAIHDERIDGARPAVAALLEQAVAENGRTFKPMVLRRLIHTAFRLGGEDNARRLMEVAASERIDHAAANEALRLLSQWPKPHPVDQSIGIWDPLPAREVGEVVTAVGPILPALLAGADERLAPALKLIETLELGGRAISADELLKIVMDGTRDESARVTALDLWLPLSPANIEETLIKLSADPSDRVATEALEFLAKRDPAKAVEGVKAALASTSDSRRQAAWKVLAELPGDAATGLIVEGLRKASDPAVMLEILEAAESREEPEVKSALEAHRAAQDASDPLAAWAPALQGGDPRRGEDVFYNHGTAQCMRCHQAGESGHGNGGDAGPNLAGIGSRHDRRYLLEALIVPGAEVAPGFGVISLTLKDGHSLGGILLEETDEHYDLAVGETTWRVRKTDVESATTPASGMPPMGALIDVRQARDLVAFLESLKTPLKDQPKKPEPQLYQPKN